MRGKKSVAVLTAVLMGIGTMSTGVYAADSYKETEKAAFQKALQKMTAQYGEELAQYDTLVAGQAANLTLTVEDAGRAILGMIAPVDVSWLGDVSLSANVSMADKKTTEMMDVLVNGAKICSLEYYLDMETMDVYMRIPELNEGFIRMNMTESAELAAQQAEELKKSAEESGEELPDTASAEAALKEMRASLAISSNMREILPEAAIAESILNRYGTILLDSVTDGVSGTEVLNASGVSQECKVLEGSIPAKDAVPMLQEILSTAKADEELKAIIEAWTEASEDENISYAAFIDAIEKQEAELEGASGAEGKEAFGTKLWLNDADEIIGRQISITDAEGAEQPMLTYMSTREDDNSGFYMEFGADGSYVSLSGSGVLNGDLLSGTYVLSADGTDAAIIEVTDYDTAAIKENILRGTYSISIAPAEDESGSYNLLAGFEAVVSFDGDKENTIITLGINSAGAGLVSLELATKPGEKTEYLDTASIGKTYDINKPEDGEAYTAEMNLDAIVDNLIAAGMPEDFIENLTAAMSGSAEEAAAEDAAA